jgi:MHS family proline/betaine transporter-like MFS transporter
MGNVLEWYDFALYGYFAFIIAPLFFQADDQLVALIESLGVFAIGFLTRPIGAVLFGHLGDKYGRKKSLSLAIFLMAIPTALIGCLPGHQQIGLWAPLLLILCRLLQGLAVGGEYTSSMVYLLEHTHKARRGLISGIIMASAFIGLIIGSTTAFIVGLYIESYPELWRAPFIFSLLLGAIGLYLRLYMPESPAFIALQKKEKLKKIPIRELLKHHKTSSLLAMLVVAIPSTSFYLNFIYLSNHLQLFLHKSLDKVMLINTMTMGMIVLSAPFFGLIADKIGERRVLSIGGILFLLSSIPCYQLINQGNLHLIAFLQLYFGLLVGLSYSAIPLYLYNLFPADLRVSGVSLPYNLANGIFGGTAPLVATFLIYLIGYKAMPGVYLSLIALIGLMALILPERVTNDSSVFNH